jgi:hypothetical protein
MVTDFQLTKNELNTTKKELEFLRTEKQRFDLQTEQYKQTIMRNEILHKQKIARLINQIRELKSLKR